MVVLLQVPLKPTLDSVDLTFDRIDISRIFRLIDHMNLLTI